MSNKEKFLKLVTETDTQTLKDVAYRVKNRDMLRASQRIALKVLSKLDELGWTQKKLAEAMQVTPQQITKIVSGKENLTIETQVKLQRILDIPILAGFGFADTFSSSSGKEEKPALYPDLTQFKVGIFAEERESYQTENANKKNGEHINDLGDWIRMERKKQGIIAAELAKMTNLSTAAIYKMEKNAQETSLKVLSQVLNALNAKATLLVRSDKK
jgi:transcriptional regulator with XRE-family HTH domain